jgi:hypothetical protein
MREMNKCNRIGLFAAAAAAVTTDLSYPPFFQDATGDELTRRAQAIYAELGRRLEAHGSGGASESARA